LVWADVYRVKPEHIVAILPRIVVTAVVVACVEEFLFRGVLQGLAVRGFGKVVGVGLVAVCFAVVHFIRPSKEIDAEVTWLTGFVQITRIFGGAPGPVLLIFGLLALVLVGLILGWVTVRTRSLALAIGLHCGWVAGQQAFQWFAKYRVKPADALLPWVGPNVLTGAVPTGLLPLAVLVLTGFVVLLYVRHVRRRPASLCSA
jgi:membrane protease YdiL (CAAX protease family)